jgi:protein arginine N-methyltransferase 1
MYDVNDYGRMMADTARMSAYTEALRRAVKPGSVVVDVGTGTGVFALLAASFGARKVYAIDVSPCVDVAREVAEANGFGETIDFIQKSVFDVELPEQADVLIADCRGVFTLFGNNLEIFMHARRWLRDGATVIPLRDHLYAGIVEWPDARDRLEAPWRLGGFDWTRCREEGMSTRVVSFDNALEGARFLVEGKPWATIDFAAVATPNAGGRFEATAVASGRAQFVVLWFVSDVADGLTISSGAATPRQVYSPVLLPIEPELAIEAGEAVKVRVEGLKTADSYVFAWAIEAKSGRTRQMSGARAARTSALNFAHNRGNVRSTG